MKFHQILAVCAVCAMTLVSCNKNELNTDILIVGGGASGTAAGLQAARMGVNAIIVEESPWLGGMLTSAGVKLRQLEPENKEITLHLTPPEGR